MRNMLKLKGLLAAAIVLVVGSVQLGAQERTATISGLVNGADGGVLMGAQVIITNTGNGSEYGAVTGSDGRYAVAGLAPGTYRMFVRQIGFGPAAEDGLRILAGQNQEFNFVLGITAIRLDAIDVLASRAIERATPVAYSNVDKEQIEQQLGSQDIPLIMNTTPSVYSTEQGGAAGDARINVRGFDQRNVAIMINGVPINDMENGWVYWSNWDGVGDVTSTIQLQRGLSAVNLTTPAVGGSMNIITDAAAARQGGMVKQEFGTDGFIKTTAQLATGRMGNFALTVQGTRKTGNGLAEGIWTDAWSYFVGASYQFNDRNKLDFFAIGAPQRHGQRLYKQNIGAFSSEFALGLSDYDPAALLQFTEAPGTSLTAAGAGFRYNENWNAVSTSYTGLQAAGTSRFNRHEAGFLNERENFFHKPQINLNWYSALSETMTLSTVSYYSGGRGGGTGTIGSLEWDYSGPSRVADWDATIARNAAEPGGVSRGILRNSRNNQWTLGVISKLQTQISTDLTVELGVDWRTASIDHFREVRDLLGGTGFLNTSSDFFTAAEEMRGLGDKIAYDNTNKVSWLGGHLQAEYSTSQFTFYGMGGLSTISYDYTDHFRDAGLAAGGAATGAELQINSGAIGGYQFKAGGLYNINDQIGVFVNGGYTSKVPIFDGVIDDNNGVLNENPLNEKVLSFEGGLNFRSLDRALSLGLNAYYTQWNDRTRTRTVLDENGEDALISLLGLDALHSGIELEASYRLTGLLRVDLSVSKNNWHYTDDAVGTYRPDARDAATVNYVFYVRDLKVGDAPQTQASLSLSIFPVEGLFLQFVGRTFGSHFAAFDPFGRTDETDRTQSWQVPNYTVVDGHFSYTLPDTFLQFAHRTKVFLHVYNLLDATYILDAVDNSRFNGFDGDHDADDAEVNFGLQRRFNMGLQVNF